MATISVSLPVEAGAAGYQLAGHPHATLTHPSLGTLTLPVTRPNPQLPDATPDWTQVYRPGRDPLLLPKGNKLRVVQLEVVLIGPTIDDDQAEFLYAVLGRMAGDRQPVVFNNFGSLTAGSYQITKLSLVAQRMRNSDNHITWAEVQLELTATTSVPPVPGVPPPPTPAVPPSSTNSPAAPKTSVVPSQQPGPRRYTVVAGDTLWSIAAKFYGNGNLWPKVAQANSINDTRKLSIGVTLVIP